MSENYTLKPAPILKVGKLPRENIFYSATSKAAGMMQTEGPVLTQSLTNLCYIFIVGQKSTEYANVKEKSSCFGKILHFSIYNYTLRAFYAQTHLSWIFCII